MISGQDAEATGVEGEALVPAKLGAEVGDRVGEVGSVCAREPVIATTGHVVVEGSDNLVNLHQELRIFEKRLPINGARADGYRIPCRDPAGFMNAAEECASLGVPRPPKVVRDATQTLKARWNAEGVGCR